MKFMSCGASFLAFLLLALQVAPPVAAQSQDLVVDICTTPNKYWNRHVLLKGHIVKVTPDPPGTNRGRYTLRDQSDKDLEVITDDLPAQGKVYVINGVVEQRKPGDSVPVVRESSRSMAQPDSAVGNPEKVVPATAPVSPDPAAPPRSAGSAGKSLSKKEVEETIRRELEKAKEAQARQAPAASTTPVAPPPAAPVASPGFFDNSLLVGGIAVLAVALIAVLLVATRKKPAAAAAYPPPAAPPAFSPPASAGMPTQVSVGAATVAAGKSTEVVTRLGGELQVSDGPDRGRNYSISKPTTTIGRSGQRKNDLELTDTTVSREQAKVIYNNVDKSFKLINESATNPTRVNGAGVDAVALQDGDRIEFGNTVVKFKKV